MVMDLDDSFQIPIFLGRPFLAIVAIAIDVLPAKSSF